MAENYGSLEGVLDANETLEGEIDSHDEMSGEIQFSGGVGGVKDVQVNNESVVDANKVAHIDLTPYAEKEDVYDKDAVNTLLEGKADTDDIPTKLSQLDNDANYVQDANYVHTDNNFTDEDKAAIGNIPENITDLSDVAVDNIQNGQVLKWDVTQEKFVNADESGGGGDVTDVKVNNTSVVDAQGVANIDLTGYAETSDIPTDLADLSDDATHRLVTDTEKLTWDNKADVSDIPTVNNNTITIQKNGQNVDSFMLNQNSNKAINIAVPTKTSDLQNDDSFITNTVDNLANYYLKSQTYTQTEVDALIDAAINGRFQKVNVLPATGEPNVIYLVPKATPETSNACDEYIWQDNDWELIGSTNIDLSGYVTDEELTTALADYLTTSAFNTAIANYYTKTEVGNLLDSKVDKVSGKGLSTYDYDATAKGIVDNVTTNLAGKVDKVNGKGLSTEDYTTTEKNKLSGISTGANKVESSTTNGNIRIDGTETQVYDGSGKVDKVNGKGLSTNDYDNTDKAKVDKINTTTTSISGNPISISGLKSNQLAVNPIITFEPIQAGSGTPSPSNIRAISGYDKIEVLSCGKNLIDESTYQVGDAAHGTMAKAFSQSDNRPYLAAGTKFVLSINGSGSGVAWISVSQKPNSSDLSEFLVIDFISSRRFSSDNPIIGTMPVSGYLAFSIQDIGGDLNVARAMKLMLEIGETSTTYAPYHKTTDLSESLGQTVYWGNYNPRTGEFEVTHKCVDMGDLNWSGNTYFGVALSDMKAGTTIIGNTDSICSCFQQASAAAIYENTIDNAFSAGGTYIGSRMLSVRYNAYLNNLAGFKTAVTGQKIVYPLATPFTIQLTPHEISLLKDYAYVSTNGTNIALDYHNGELASLSDVSQLGETLNKGLIPFTLDISNQMTKLLSSATFKAYRNGNVVQIAGRTGALSNGVNNIVQIPNALRDTNQMPIPMYIYLSASDSGKVNGMYIDGSGIIAASANSATGNGIIFSVVYVLP